MSDGGRGDEADCLEGPCWVTAFDVEKRVERDESSREIGIRRQQGYKGAMVPCRCPCRCHGVEKEDGRGVSRDLEGGHTRSVAAQLQKKKRECAGRCFPGFSTHLGFRDCAPRVVSPVHPQRERLFERARVGAGRREQSRLATTSSIEISAKRVGAR